MKKLLCVFLAFLFLVLSLCACSTESVVADEMYALDTIISFKIYDDDETLCKDTIEKCKTEITRLENLLSATKEGTDVFNINNSNGEQVQVSDETAKLIETSLKVSNSCGGAFDVSVYPVVKLWGFDTKNYIVPSDEEIEKTLEKVNYKDVTVDDDTVALKKGMSIDLGGIAKGYIGNRLYGIFAEQNIARGLINLGGMIVVYNSDDSADSFSLGVEYPDSGEVFAQFDTKIPFTVTSGAYQRYFEENGTRYHHIIDTSTGKPAQSDISSVTVIGYDGTYCDALSTAFFVMGTDKTIEYLKNCTDDEENDYSIIILSKNKDKLYITRDIAESGFELYKEFENKIEIKVIDTMIA